MQTANQIENANRAVRLFQDHYHCSPDWIASSPGRVNLLGGHVDYNGGVVFPFCLDRHTVIAAGWPTGPASAGSQARWTFFSELADEQITIDSARLAPSGHWSDYLKGIIASFQESGMPVPTMHAVIYSSIPAGSGLSSSAALTVSFATLLNTAFDYGLDSLQMARICQRAESGFAGTPCGLMDQVACLCGKSDHLLRFDCSSTSLDWLPLTNERIQFLVVDSRTRHQLADGQYQCRRLDCEAACRKLSLESLRHLKEDVLTRSRSLLNEHEFQRATHVVRELKRCERMQVELARDDWPAIGDLLFESHDSLRDRYQVSCPELDQLVESAKRTSGVYGMRMTGGGFGGCTVAIVDTDRTASAIQKIGTEFRERFDKSADFLLSRPVDGAIALPLNQWD